MAIVQRWGCDKCAFAYGSPVRLSSLDHHCPPKSTNVKPAKMIEGLEPRPIKKTAPKPRIEPVKHSMSEMKAGKMIVKCGAEKITVSGATGFPSDVTCPDCLALMVPKRKGRVIKRRVKA